MYILFNLSPKLATAFSNSSVLKKWKLILQLWYFAITRKTVLRGKKMRFSFVYRKNSFNLTIESIVDLAALREVFIEEEYKWSLPNDPKIIVDLGAHFGDTALYYHFCYPNARIYAVEPAPETFKRLQQNIAPFEKITAIQVGLADRDGYADLHIVASSLGSSFHPRSDVQSTVSVPVCTLSSLLQMCDTEKADIIKFDIEGAEEALFIDGSPQDFAEAYIGEVHADLISLNPEEFVEKFKDFVTEQNQLTNSKRFILRALKKHNE